MMKTFFCAATVFISTLSMASANPIDSLNFYTEDAPPLNFRDGGLKGITVDLLSEIFKRSGSSKKTSDVKVVPWARGYDALEKGPNTVLFATAKTENRTPLFKWVGPITDLNIVILIKKGSAKIITAEDLYGLKIATVLNDVGEQLLLSETKYPETNLKRASLESGLKKLDAGRVDALAFVELTARYSIGKLGLKQEDFVVGYELLKLGLYYAASKDVNEDAISSMQKALDSIRADGTLNKIIGKYL